MTIQAPPTTAVPIGTGTMLEPPDGTRLVMRNAVGDHSIIWRDDTAAANGEQHPDDRWFLDTDEPPVSWQTILTHAVSLSALVEITTARRGPTDVHTWFSRSYTNYLVEPRTLLQSMPTAWQHAFAALLIQLDDAYAHVARADGYDVQPGRWKHAGECDDAELARAGAELVYDDPAASAADLDDASEPRYSWRGEELAADEYLFVPGGEPVPDYNRGRTRIPPRTLVG